MWYTISARIANRTFWLGLFTAATAVTPARAAEASSASIEHLPNAAGAHARAADGKRQGALYRLKRGTQTSYLFGTLHVGRASFYPLAPEVSQALALSTQLVVELDTRGNDAFALAVARHGSYRQGDDVRRHISPDTLDQLRQALHAVGITVASVAHLKPWLLANLLMSLELERSGFVRSHGLETYLLANAHERGSTVSELESADYQLAMFDSLNERDAERYLGESLRDLADGTSLRKARSLVDAWTSGDARALDKLLPELTGNGSLHAEFTRHTLLGKRNREMAARIGSLMQDGQTTFVGVGLLHLLGENGLPRLLSQHGFEVERIY